MSLFPLPRQRWLHNFGYLRTTSYNTLSRLGTDTKCTHYELVVNETCAELERTDLLPCHSQRQVVIASLVWSLYVKRLNMLLLHYLYREFYRIVLSAVQINRWGTLQNSLDAVQIYDGAEDFFVPLSLFLCLSPIMS